ncbi:MAG: metallophosphoesterase [Candidatus Micrarchaeota archaeon]
MRFLHGYPAILHQGALIIGDTHFGIERKLQKKGIYYNNLSETIFEKIKLLLKKTNAKKLIILGDVKDEISFVDSVTKNILLELEKICELTIVRGNHDGGIEMICKNVMPSEGYIYKGLGLLHGNAWPDKNLMECNYIVVAHEHPIIKLVDRLEKIHFKETWIVCKINQDTAKNQYKKYNKKIKLIVMPAFNSLVGSAKNIRAKEHLGPLLKNNIFDVDNAEIYNLDGNLLGVVHDFISPDTTQFHHLRRKNEKLFK